MRRFLSNAVLVPVAQLMLQFAVATNNLSIHGFHELVLWSCAVHSSWFLWPLTWDRSDSHYQFLA